MRHSLTSLCNGMMVVAFAVLVFLSPGPSEGRPQEIKFVSAEIQHRDPVVNDGSEVWVSKIDPLTTATGRPRWYVTWSDGKRRVLNPCRYEDGRNCFWQADKVGNKIGDSFVVSRGQIWFIWYAD